MFDPDISGGNILKFFFKNLTSLTIEGDNGIRLASSSMTSIPICIKGGKPRVIAAYNQIKNKSITALITITHRTADEPFELASKLIRVNKIESSEEQRTLMDEIIHSVVFKDTDFDISLLDHRERRISQKAYFVHKQKSLHAVSYILVVTSLALILQPHPNLCGKPLKRIPLNSIAYLARRIFSGKPIALEISENSRFTQPDGFPSKIQSASSPTPANNSLNKNRCWLLTFSTFEEREQILLLLQPKTPTAFPDIHLIGQSQESIISFTNKSLAAAQTSESPTERRHLSSFSRLKGKLQSTRNTIRNATSSAVSNRPKSQTRRQVPEVLNSGALQRATQLWQIGRLSNFHYLDFLNSASGRSRADLSQYPVFPWTLRNFKSDNGSELDLTNPTNYRDFSKPVGAQDPSRVAANRRRMEETPEDGEKFLYGTHYSTPAFVAYFLLRVIPESQLRLQSGKFDAWTRLFHSVGETAKNAWASGTLELIPQFYENDPRFLLDTLHIEPEGGKILGDVNIPLWEPKHRDSKNVFLPKNGTSPLTGEAAARNFLVHMRAALESPYVSAHLPKWIDIIFGCNQRGQPALDNNNLFHPSAYTTLNPFHHPVVDVGQSNNDSTAVHDFQDDVIIAQLREFGVVPFQLFDAPHPSRIDYPEFDASTFFTDPFVSAPWYLYVQSNPSLRALLEGREPIIMLPSAKPSPLVTAPSLLRSMPVSSPVLQETTTASDAGNFGSQLKLNQKANVPLLPFQAVENLWGALMSSPQTDPTQSAQAANSNSMNNIPGSQSGRARLLAALSASPCLPSSLASETPLLQSTSRWVMSTPQDGPSLLEDPDASFQSIHTMNVKKSSHSLCMIASESVGVCIGEDNFIKFRAASDGDEDAGRSNAADWQFFSAFGQHRVTALSFVRTDGSGPILIGSQDGTLGIMSMSCRGRSSEKSAAVPALPASILAFVRSGHSDAVNATSVVGSTVFSGSQDYSVKTWSLSDGAFKLDRTLDAHTAPVSLVSPVMHSGGGSTPSSSSTHVFVSTSREEVLLWDLRTPSKPVWLGAVGLGDNDFPSLNDGLYFPSMSLENRIDRQSRPLAVTADSSSGLIHVATDAQVFFWDLRMPSAFGGNLSDVLPSPAEEMWKGDVLERPGATPQLAALVARVLGGRATSASCAVGLGAGSIQWGGEFPSSMLLGGADVVGLFSGSRGARTQPQIWRMKKGQVKGLTPLIGQNGLAVGAVVASSDNSITFIESA